MSRKLMYQHFAGFGVICGLVLVLYGFGWTFDRQHVTESENGYYYTVQKGDTLWDLSRRFSATPWVWPELWEENNEVIANPHLIYPGQKIRLTRLKGGRTAEAPVVAEPLLKGIHFYYSSMNQVGFIRKTPVTPDGVIFKTREAAREMISKGDIVYIRPEGNAGFSKGQLFTIFRTHDPILDQNTKELIGTQHMLFGVVEIIQAEPEYAVAKVVDSYRTIRIGDKLMPFHQRPPRIEIQKSHPGIDARIILPEENMSIFAELNVAFIDRGKTHGIRPGQIYSIYYRDEHNFGTPSSPKKVYTPVDCGELIVLHVEDHTATILITDSDQEFFAGTRIRTPLAVR
jgi:hypothetical protein